MKKHPTEESKARQRNLFIDDRSLFEKLCDLHNLQAGFKAVKKNGGAPGVDEVTVEEYASRLDEELAQLKKDLEGWSYKPNPVRRVEIPKPGKGAGVRLLGVPCIRDRVVHATLKLLLEADARSDLFRLTATDFARVIISNRRWKQRKGS